MKEECPEELAICHLKQGDRPDSEFDSKQLSMGVEVETEHTDNKALAKQIAKAHLVENTNYYTYLDKMEKEMDEDKENEMLPF